MKKKVIIVGTGAGGATVAKELANLYDVVIVEAGREFQPFKANLSGLEKLRKTGLFFDERQIQLLFPSMKIRKTADKMVLVNGIATGGTTTLSTGNALRMDKDLKAIGIHLNDEFNELFEEVPISIEHHKKWRSATKRLFDICHKMGFEPQITPKMGLYHHCIQCGRCVLGCPQGVKWDSRKFLQIALKNGARLMTGACVIKVAIRNGSAVGVHIEKNWRRRFLPADLVILAAGGFGTPVILHNSGIKCEPKLFVDPVLCVAAEWHDAMLNREIPMPFFIQQKHFMVSPYFDHLSFYFNRDWRVPARRILSLMIKLADENNGSIRGKKINKKLLKIDRDRLQKGIELCTEILLQFGVTRKHIFLGTINAGHPGGMLPLTKQSAITFHPEALPNNLYVADATLFPRSQGNPPILTIMAMAKRVSHMCKKALS